MRAAGKAILGRGWAFPLAFEPDRGIVRTAFAEEDIHQSLYILLSTARGERVMRPEFGCGIHEIVFGVINTSLITQVRHHVETAVRKFEARIDLLAVEVDVSGATDGRRVVNLDYRVRATNQSGNFVYPFYFKEAN